MQKLFRGLRNIFINAPKRIKEIGDSNDAIHYKCLKCNADLVGHKGYGKLLLLCKCGNSAYIYTGKDIHFNSDTKKSNKDRILSDIIKFGIIAN